MTIHISRYSDTTKKSNSSDESSFWQLTKLPGIMTQNLWTKELQKTILIIATGQQVQTHTFALQITNHLIPKIKSPLSFLQGNIFTFLKILDLEKVCCLTICYRCFEAVEQHGTYFLMCVFGKISHFDCSRCNLPLKAELQNISPRPLTTRRSGSIRRNVWINLVKTIEKTLDAIKSFISLGNVAVWFSEVCVFNFSQCSSAASIW